MTGGRRGWPLLLALLVVLLAAGELGVLTVRAGSLVSFVSRSVTTSPTECPGDDPSPPVGHPITASTPADVACYNFHRYRVTTPITLCINDSGRMLRRHSLTELAQQALATWEQDAGETLPVTIGGACETPSSGSDVISWGTLGESRVGFTRVNYKHGHAVQATVSLEASPERLPESCISAVLLHEFGHVLGLDHQTHGSSIMRPSTNCPADAAPSSADIDAIRYLYPAGQASAPASP